MDTNKYVKGSTVDGDGELDGGSKIVDWDIVFSFRVDDEMTSQKARLIVDR